MTTTAIETINLTKMYDDNLAVHNINLQIKEGEFFSFLGPSGCGKTTLLRMIAGFERPTSGQLIVAGKEMQKIPAHKRPVNLVFQNYALFPHMSVAENIAFGLRSKGIYTSFEISKMVSESLELVRLKQLSDRYPSQLSGGQQQRVALARAAVNRPKVLLLDEPLSALDPQIRQEMQEELGRLQSELNLTFVMVTHDQGEALSLSQRVAVFSKGNLEQVGSPAEIYECPETVFVAEFIGQTNLIPATVHKVTSSLTEIDVGGSTFFSVTPPVNPSGSAEIGAEVTMWVKPHAIAISANHTDHDSMANTNTFLGTVVNCSYQGFITEYVIRLTNGVRLRVIQSRQAEHLDLGQIKEGTNIVGCFPASACSFFLASNGRNIPDLVS